MKPIRLLGISASLLLLVGSARAQTTVFNPGVLRIQMWTDSNPNGVSSPSKAQVEAGLAGLPTTDSTDLTILEVPQTSPDLNNYTRRITGFFIPAVTTNYTFFINSDDNSDLFFSTDSSPSNKRLIAQQPGWSQALLWVTDSGGGNDLTQKRSDKWTPDGGAHVPFASGIPLTAGQKYWIEAVHNEAGGGDNVAVTFKFAGGPDPADGSDSLLTGSLIGYGYTIPASLTILTNTTNVTVVAGREATFTFLVANTLPDPLAYQWYRNGSVISNATFQQYTFLTTAADSGGQYQCVVTLPPSYNNSLAVTGAVGTLTVNAGSIAYTNGLKIERFLGSTRTDVENGRTGAASDIAVSTGDGSAFHNYTGAEAIPNDAINNYARRMSGWFIPPTSGNYVFFLSSDDDADLFLSTDNTAAKKTLIAQENNWSNSRQWTNSPGGSVLSQKRSDQWTNDLGDAPFTNGIQLTAGTPYYIEADSHQGGGGDNLGVLAQLVGAPDPTNNAPPIPSNQLSLLTTLATTLTWSSQPIPLTVFEGNLPVFTGKAVSDSEFAVQYQWRRGGTNIAGATGTSYTFTTVAADSGAQFDLVAATAEGGLSITSAPVTLTVNAAVFEPGLMLMQYWINQTDQTLGERLLLGPPTFQMAVEAMGAGINTDDGDNYVNSLSGFFIPPADGAYDFIIAGDDHCDLFLSTDSNPNNKRMIAQEPGWSNSLQWGSEGQGGVANAQKHSDTWTNANSGGLAPFGAGIQLKANTRYYIEAWHQEGGGGDNLGVTYKKHSDPDPNNNDPIALKGSVIGFNAVAATFANITQQPTNVTALSGTTATLTAAGASDGKVPIGSSTLQFQRGTAAGATNFASLPFVLFQWFKNGVAIPGASSTSYTTPLLKPTDGAQYTVEIRALGIAHWTTSSIATLTIISDTNKPTANFAAVFDGNNLLPVISVTFSKIMDVNTLSQMANYQVSGGGASIVGIVVDTNNFNHVQLQLAQEPTGPITLTFSGITDFSGNALATTTLNVAPITLINSDIGDISAAGGGDPAWPGFMWADGTNAFTISCQGSDIWNAGDGFNFTYEQKTNDFDVVVRQKTFTKVSNWSKGGLMVREDLTFQSRNWNIVNDPTSADGIGAIDGSGTGANTVECNTRSTNAQASLSWSTGPATVPAYPNAWVRLKRVGQLLHGYWSSNGVDWVQEGLTDWSTNAVPMPPNVYVGIACTAHNNNAVDATTLNFYYTASFADYNSSFVASTNAGPAKLTAKISGGNVVISWSPAGGTLQSSPSVGAGAPWTPVGTANPSAPIPIAGAADKFFRVGP